MSIDARTPVTELLGDRLGGEHVVFAIQFRSSPTGYQRLIGLLTRGGLYTRNSTSGHYWWLVVTETRVLIVRRADDTGWVGDHSTFEARRTLVKVERFTRTGLTSWWLVLQLDMERWSLHSLTAFGSVPIFGSSYNNARPIAEALGWKPRSQR